MGEGERPMDDRKNMPQNNGNVIQNLILENREKLTITGVVDVLSFDDQIVIVETQLGLLTVKGEDLRINKLSIDSLEVGVRENGIRLVDKIRINVNDESEEAISNNEKIDNEEEIKNYLSELFKIPIEKIKLYSMGG